LKNDRFFFKTQEGETFTSKYIDILRINPPKIGGGLKFEPASGIGQKETFLKGFASRLGKILYVLSRTCT
jgi:hypothetical protein